MFLEDRVAPVSALSRPTKRHGLAQAGSRVIHKLAQIDEPSAMEARQCVVESRRKQS